MGQFSTEFVMGKSVMHHPIRAGQFSYIHVVYIVLHVLVVGKQIARPCVQEERLYTIAMYSTDPHV